MSEIVVAKLKRIILTEWRKRSKEWVVLQHSVKTCEITQMWTTEYDFRAFLTIENYPGVTIPGKVEPVLDSWVRVACSEVETGSLPKPKASG